MLEFGRLVPRALVFFSLCAMMPSLSAAAAKKGAGRGCKDLRFADVGWSDIAATTAVATNLLATLGYQTKVMNLSVPVTYASLKNNDIDIFLGNWMPTMAADIKPYTDSGSVETVGTILSGARYTLAVPQYVFDAGVKSFADISRFKDKFKGKIFGIEAGNDGNRLISSMIEKDAFGLKGFKLVESSEQAMLMEVERLVKQKAWVIFLAWEPHPMNKRIGPQYLPGGDDFFGPNLGGSTVFINTRKGLSKECPEVGTFLGRLNFSILELNQLMDLIFVTKADPAKGAAVWLKENPKRAEEWLKGLSRVGG